MQFGQLPLLALVGARDQSGWTMFSVRGMRHDWTCARSQDGALRTVDIMKMQAWSAIMRVSECVSVSVSMCVRVRAYDVRVCVHVHVVLIPATCTCTFRNTAYTVKPSAHALTHPLSLHKPVMICVKTVCTVSS